MNTGYNAQSFSDRVEGRMFQKSPNKFRGRLVAHVKIYQCVMRMAERCLKEIPVVGKESWLGQPMKKWQ
ncbi:MAG TPA: hypothetical protein VFC44_13815 [Candidatus Saccharimonadales bacterium]|nr:hypothetical protein [Candidatus Saccharimonadales bacterium]